MCNNCQNANTSHIGRFCKRPGPVRRCSFTNKEFAIFHRGGFAIIRKLCNLTGLAFSHEQGVCNLPPGWLCDHSRVFLTRATQGLVGQLRCVLKSEVVLREDHLGSWDVKRPFVELGARPPGVIPASPDGHFRLGSAKCRG